MGAQTQHIHPPHNSCTEGSENTMERVGKDRKSQRPRKSAVRLSSRSDREASSMTLTTRPPKQDLKKSNTNKHTNTEGGNLMGTHP